MARGRAVVCSRNEFLLLKKIDLVCIGGEHGGGQHPVACSCLFLHEAKVREGSKSDYLIGMLALHWVERCSGI